MAKDGKGNLPSVDKPTADWSQPTNPIEDLQKAAEVARDSVGYVPRRVDVKMTRAQAIILRDKLRQLQDSGAKTADGRFVSNRTQAVQWILENEVTT